MEKKNKEIERKKTPEIVSTSCNDIDCPFHGSLKLRGRTFNGKVIKKFQKRITIEFDRTEYIRKYERYIKLKTKIHARLPVCIEKNINVGDYVKIVECRPLSKIIHFVVTDKVKGGEKL
ncbi:MAG: 30S ribosomal protein S17 [Candidatus Nanoarchaeia archaeon]